MPGIKLSNYEKQLDRLWRQPPKELKRSSLRSIEISGGSGLRGLDGVLVPFRYPLTVLCGPNSVGKSTVLALATLSCHSPQGWFVHWGNAQPHRTKGDRTYYTFSDFFIRCHNEQSMNGATVTWRFLDNDREISKTFTKSKRGWGRYADRPEREVYYLPLSRLIPSYEMTGVRSTFSKENISKIKKHPLNVDFCAKLSYIMARNYRQADFQRSGRWVFQNCESDIFYTAFNMGGGESCIIAMLYLLQRLPPGGLLVVEEIEVGLHPEAQVRLAEILVDICLKRRVQIICTSHSEVFIDALPRQARVLIRRSGYGHLVHPAPSTRFASSEMSGRVFPELNIYCEDSTAATLIEESLSQAMRARVLIHAVGSDATVIRHGVCDLRCRRRMRSLCVLDGDCTKVKINRWLKSETGDQKFAPEYIILPGEGNPPEKWLTEQLRHSIYESKFAEYLGCSIGDARRHIQVLGVELDHHSLGFILHQRTGKAPDHCRRQAMAAVAPRHPQLELLRTRISDMLEG